jgi:YbbR domain-containing protein
MDKWLRNVNVVRIIALLVSIMLWVVVHMDQNIDTTSNQPVSVESTFNNITITSKYDAENYYISSIEPASVQFIAKGRETIVNKLRTNTKYQIVLDMSKYVAGEYDIALEKQGFPAGVEIEIVPTKVHVVLEKLQSKTLPVQFTFTGIPIEGYAAQKSVLTPINVKVKSTSATIAEVTSIRGEINIDQADKEVKQSVLLQAYNSKGKLLDVTIIPNQIDVTVPISKINDALPLDISLRGELAPGFAIQSITITPNEVAVLGDPEVLVQLQRYAGGEIDITNLDVNKQFIVPIELLEGITEVTPKSAEVSLNVVPATSSNLSGIPIQLIGLKPENTGEIQSPQIQTISVTLVGAQQLLNNITVDDVKATIDVSNLSAGVHQVKITFALPAFVKVIEQSETTATVKIN